MSKIRRVTAFSAHEKRMIAQTLFWLWFFRVRNLILPYRLARKWMSEEITDDLATDLRNEGIIKEVTSSLRRCRRYVPGATCLIQALAAKTVLKHYGQPSYIRLGVIRSDVSIDAHAWVEVEGRIIFGAQPNNSRFSVLQPPSIS